MTDIKVIKRTEVDAEKLSREEREALLNETAQTSKLPKYHFANFLEIEDTILAKETWQSKTEILSVLLRKLFQYDCVIPILEKQENPMKDIVKIREYFSFSFMDSSGLGSSKKSGKSGGSSENTLKNKNPKENTLKNKNPKENPKEQNPKEKEEKEEKEETQFNKTKHVIYIDDLEKGKWALYQIAPNVSIKVIGFVINYSHLTAYNEYENEWVFNIFDRLMTGAWDFSRLNSELWTPFRAWKDNIYENFLESVANTPVKKIGDKPYIVFDNINQAKDVSLALFGFLNYLDSTYGISRELVLLARLAADMTLKLPDTGNEPINYLGALMKLYNERDVKEVVVDHQFTPSEIELEFLKSIEDITNYKMSHMWNSSIPSDITTVRATDIYNKFLMSVAPETESSDGIRYRNELSKEIVSRKQDVDIEIVKAKRRKKYDQIKYDENVMRWLYIAKFGLERFNEIVPRGYQGRIAKILDKKEATLIDIDHKRIVKRLEERKNNTCEHLAVEHKLRYSLSKDSLFKDLFKDLQPFISAEDKSISKTAEVKKDFIKCKVCGFDLICPHVRDLIILKSQHRKNDEEIRALILKYAGNVPVYQAYYCNICGEEITHNIEMEGEIAFATGQKLETFNVEDELQDFIWGSANFIVRTFIEFRGVQTNKFINSFTRSIISGVYEFINTINKKLRRAKTISNEEVEDRLKIYTDIYILALLIKVIKENPKAVWFASPAGHKKHAHGGGNRGAPPLQKLFETALDILMGSRNILIKKLVMSTDMVKTSLFKSFKNVTSLLDKTKIKHDPEEDAGVTLMLDPVYRYYVYMHLLTYLHSKDSKKITVSQIEKKEKDLQNPLNSTGHTLENLIKEPHIFAKAAPIKTSVFGENLFNKLIEAVSISKTISETSASLETEFKDYTEIRYIKSPDEDKKIDEFLQSVPLRGIDLLKALGDGFRVSSWELIWDYIQEQVYVNPVVIVTASKVKHEEETAKFRVQYSPIYKKHMDKVSNFNRAVEIYTNLIKYYTIRGYFRTKFAHEWHFKLANNFTALMSNSYGTSINTKFPSNLLSENAQKIIKKKPGFHFHKWSLYEYVYGATKKIMSVGEAKSSCSDPKRGHFIKKYCEVCLHSPETVISGNPDPVGLMEEYNSIINFYNYYTNLCPSGSNSDPLHAWVEETAKCKNCGLTKQMLNDKDSNYYKKFSSTFYKSFALKENSGIEKELSANKINFTQSVAAESPLETKKISSWKWNPNIVSEFVNSTYPVWSKDNKIKKPAYFNMWMNLGIVENEDWNDVKSGKISLFDLVETDDAYAHKRINIVSQYVQSLIVLLNTIKNYKTMTNISDEVLKVASKSKNNIVQKIVSGLSSTFHEGLIEMYRLHAKKESYHNLANWILDFLLKVLISLKEIPDVLKHMIGKILDGEKALTKLDDHSAAKLMAATGVDNNDANMIDNRSARTFDDLVNEDTEDKFEHTADYDGHNDTINT